MATVDNTTMPSSTETDYLNQAGLEFHENGDLINAEQSYLKALSIDPHHEEVLNNLLQLYQDWKRYPDALYYVTQLSHIHPTDIKILHQLAQIARECNDKPTLNSTLQKIKELGEKSAWTENEGIYIQYLPLIFVVDRPTARDAKIAYGLKQNGWKVILLHKDLPTYDPSEYFTEIRQYRNPAEALQLAESYQPAIFHVFSMWLQNTATAFIQNKPGIIIYDDYDVLAGMVRTEFLNKEYPGQLEMERYCLENADGICCRSPQTQYVKHSMGYQIKGRRMLLLDGCWGRQPLPTPSSNINDDFHIAYCGNMNLCDDPYAPGKCELLEIANILVAEKIHFHIYPSKNAMRNMPPEKGFSGYLDLAEKSNFFHFHSSVQPEQLIAEFSRYDAGWFDSSPYNYRYINEFYERHYTIYASTNKIFDYIDAGLPVIINATKFVERLLQKSGILVKITPDFMHHPRQFLEHLDWDILKSNARAAREQYSITKQTKRLIEFYQRISNDKTY